MLASLSLMFTANIPPQTQASTTTGSQCHHQSKAAVDHHLTEVVGVADEAVHAIGNEPALNAQRELLLGVGGDHDDAVQDAQAEPGVVRQRVGGPRNARD